MKKSPSVSTLAIQRTSLVEQTADKLMRAILDGTLPAGARLAEVQLGEELGVSRTPLREAIRMLEQAGFVTISPNKGAFVRTIELTDMLEVSEIRSTLEALAICLMRKRMTPELLRSLDEALQAMQEAHAAKDSLAFITQHNRYHEIIIHGSGNQMLIDILNRLRAHTNWHRFHFQYDIDAFFADSLKNHTQIHTLLHTPGVSDEELCRAEQQTAKESCDRLAAFISSKELPESV